MQQQKTFLGKDDIKQLFEQTIQADLLQHMEMNPYTKGMGTTVAGVLCREHKITIFHVGDSRVYRFRDNFIKQMTKDHSLVETLFDTGKFRMKKKELILEEIYCCGLWTTKC